MIIYMHYPTDCETLEFAASEFEAHLSLADPKLTFIHQPDTACEISSPHFHIDFHINPASVSDSEDFYDIHIDSNGGFIHASNARSVLLGVYACLRKAGFRFLLPTKTYIPESFTIEDLYMTFSHHASLRHRGVCIEGANALENVADFIDWLPKAGYNSFFLQFKEPYIFLERWYHHVFNPHLPKEALSETWLIHAYEKMAAEVRKRSLLLHAFGHGWTCEAIGLSALGWIPTKQPPTKDQEKLLAYIDHKRTFIDGIPLNTNLCYADPEAVDLFCSSVMAYIKTHQDVHYLHIWLADEVNHICECEDCQKVTLTDQYIRLLNEIDRRLIAEDLDTKLVFLLYQELLYPPVHEHIHHPERFTLMFAPISRTFKVSYPEKITEIPLKDYQRNHMDLPVSIEENLTFLSKWQKVFSGDSLMYDYPLGRAHYGDFGYISISQVLSNDIKNVKKLGLDGYISCQELRIFLPNGLPNYVMGYTSLDNSESFDALVEEYFKAAYGKDYAEVVKYLQQLSALSDCDYFNHIGKRKDEHICAQFQEMLACIEMFSTKIKAHIRKDGKMTTSDSEFCLFFWQLLDYHSEYSVFLVKALISLSSGDEDTANIYFSDFCHYININEERMQKYLDVYRIIEVAGKYTGFTLPDALNT